MEANIINYKREDIYDQQRIEELMVHYREILRLLGEDPDREGLIKTPERVAKAMSFITKGYAQDPIAILRSAMFKEEYQQMVLVKDIELFSVCEHHMLHNACAVLLRKVDIVKFDVEALSYKLGKYLVVVPRTVALKRARSVVPITHKEAYHLVPLLLKEIGCNRGVNTT